MPYSVQEREEDDERDETSPDDAITGSVGSGEDKMSEDDKNILEKLQKQALLKQNKRKQFMGDLLRSKGFIWIATSNKHIGGWQQAGNIHRVEVAGLWAEGERDEAPNSKSTMDQSGSQFFPYAGKRQELVFIGIHLKHKAIQKALDECLLTDEEMKMKPEKWNDFMEAEDKIQSALPVQLLFPPEEIIYINRVAD